MLHLCGTLWWLRKKNFLVTGVWKLRKRSSREEPDLHVPAFLIKAGGIPRDTSVPFMILFECRMHPMQPRGVWALLGRHREIQSPELGTKVLRNGDKVALRLCHTGWGHARAARAAQLTVPGQRRSGRE